MKGIAHVYKKDNINTDEIIPARYLNTGDREELAKHAMEDIDVNFVKNVENGDFIIAGKNFGCGSSREHAVWALRGAGIKAIIAESFARIFYRNCINNGLLAIECSEIKNKIFNNDEIEIRLNEGKIRNNSRDEDYSFVPIPDFAKKIIESGGLLNYISKRETK